VITTEVVRTDLSAPATRDQHPARSSWAPSVLSDGSCSSPGTRGWIHHSRSHHRHRACGSCG